VLHARNMLIAAGLWRCSGGGERVGADRGGPDVGGRYTTQRLRKTFYRLVQAAGLRKITFHHVRHSALRHLRDCRSIAFSIARESPWVSTVNESVRHGCGT
jgi:integrase